MSRRQQTIEAVAGQLTDHPDSHDSLDDLRRVNAAGWTFNIRWHDGDYPSDNDWTRVEGAVLSDADLLAAWLMAEREALGLTRYALAQRLGIAESTLSRWERGELRIERPQTLWLALRGLWAEWLKATT